MNNKEKIAIMERLIASADTILPNTHTEHIISLLCQYKQQRRELREFMNKSAKLVKLLEIEKKRRMN